MSKILSLESVRKDGMQMRAEIDGATVTEYSELLENADGDWPFSTNCKVFFDGKEYFLADGIHRFLACARVGRSNIVCDISKGSREDAQDYALAANQDHGLRRTTKDKRNAITVALSMERWFNKSDRAIAEHIGVHHQTVGAARKSLLPEKPSNGKQNAPAEPKPESKIPEEKGIIPDKRTGRDGKQHPTGNAGVLSDPKKTPRGRALDSVPRLVDQAVKQHISPIVKLLVRIKELSKNSKSKIDKVEEKLNQCLDILTDVRDREK